LERNEPQRQYRESWEASEGTKDRGPGGKPLDRLSPDKRTFFPPVQ